MSTLFPSTSLLFVSIHVRTCANARYLRTYIICERAETSFITSLLSSLIAPRTRRRHRHRVSRTHRPIHVRYRLSPTWRTIAHRLPYISETFLFSPLCTWRFRHTTTLQNKYILERRRTSETCAACTPPADVGCVKLKGVSYIGP